MRWTSMLYNVPNALPIAAAALLPLVLMLTR